ncbi:MAG: MFS transporter, partial [Alphaproteobacteria bacterium]|nr:MFS transporter [Alphaproteobacteria bacterium]
MITGGSAVNRLTLRVSLVYFAYFFYLGINTPFFTLWVDSRGFAAWAATLGAAALVARTAGQPALSYLAERTGRRMMLIVAAVVAMAATGLLALSTSYLFVLGLIILAGFFAGPVLPLTDALTLSGRGVNYGHARLWGSLGYAIANVLGGMVIDHFKASSVIWLEVLGLVMLVVVSIALPRRTPQSGATRQMDTGAENKDLGKLLVAPITW